MPDKREVSRFSKGGAHLSALFLLVVPVALFISGVTITSDPYEGQPWQHAIPPGQIKTLLKDIPAMTRAELAQTLMGLVDLGSSNEEAVVAWLDDLSDQEFTDLKALIVSNLTGPNFGDLVSQWSQEINGRGHKQATPTPPSSPTPTPTPAGSATQAPYLFAMATSTASPLPTPSEGTYCCIKLLRGCAAPCSQDKLIYCAPGARHGVGATVSTSDPKCIKCKSCDDSDNPCFMDTAWWWDVSTPPVPVRDPNDQDIILRWIPPPIPNSNVDCLYVEGIQTSKGEHTALMRYNPAGPEEDECWATGSPKFCDLMALEVSGGQQLPNSNPAHYVFPVGTEVTVQAVLDCPGEVRSGPPGVIGWDLDGTPLVTTDGLKAVLPATLSANTYTVTARPDECPTWGCGDQIKRVVVSLVSVTMLSPQADQKLCFKSDYTRELQIDCSAQVSPNTAAIREYFRDTIVFSVDAIGDSNLTWVPARGGIAEAPAGSSTFVATAVFTGLPTSNSGFGRKKVALTVGAMTAFDTERTIEVYYPALAANYPGAPPPGTPPGPNGITPNYFYYYKQTSAFYGTPEYNKNGSRTYMYHDEHYFYASWVESAIDASGMYILTPGVNGGDTLSYIDLFAWACRHETRHQWSWCEWFPQSFPLYPTGHTKADDDKPWQIDDRDLDWDWLKDSAEAVGWDPTIPPTGPPLEGGPFDPTEQDSHPADEYTMGLPDCERHTCCSQADWEPGDAIEEDWAYPGTRWQ